MRSDAQAYIEHSSEMGRRGGPNSWKIRANAKNEALTLPITPPNTSPIREAEPNLSIYKSTTTTTTQPKVEQKKPLKEKRKTSKAKFAEYGENVKEVVNTLSQEWITEDGPDKRTIHIHRADFAIRIKEILDEHQEIDENTLIQAGRDYCTEVRFRYKAPQYFFGPEGPWRGYIQDILTRTSKGEPGVTE
jgi:hypothetical protein